MYVNKIDEFFDEIIDNFFDTLNNLKFFDNIKDINFVKYLNNILDTIKKFINDISQNKLNTITNNKSHLDIIINMIKRYCALYIFFGIGYHYKGNRDMFITNIIECSKYQTNTTYQIPNFFNSENNNKIISNYNDIKNILKFMELKDFDKIKILLQNNPIKYESTIKLFNDLGEDFIKEYFMIKDNFHNIIKTLIFNQIYIKDDKQNIINLLNQIEKNNSEYKYIDVVISKHNKIIDYNIIHKYLTIANLNSDNADDIYDFIENYKNIIDINNIENDDYINFLFSNNIIIPITEEFLRYHKDTEKYNVDTLKETQNIKDRDATKIKYIINKLNIVKNLYTDTDDKKKSEISSNYFYKQIEPRKGVLINDDEDVNIIKKLKESTTTSDLEYLIELENYRKYPYVNFKNFSKDGIKIRPDNTIQGIRSINLSNKNKNVIELRIGHKNIDLNVIGIAINPSKINLNYIKSSQLKDVSKLSKKHNGYKSFMNIMDKSFFDKKNNNIYYWLFDLSKDNIKTEKYENINNVNSLKIAFKNIYNLYIELVKNKFYQDIKTFNNLDINIFNHIYNYYNKKYIEFDKIISIKNDIIKSIIIEHIKNNEITYDEDNNNKKQIIKLPIIDIPEEDIKTIQLGYVDYISQIDLNKLNIAICNHYVKWNNIMKIKKNVEEFNQAIFDFVKQYVKLNEKNDYICKSCFERLSIEKYVYEGTYVKELDTFLTTSIAVNEKLENIPKYAKYQRTIKNIEKNIEKIAYSLDLNYFIGNDVVSKLKRRMLTKDIIDLILIHTEWLKKNPNRKEEYKIKYNINPELSNLFFFELKDDIFLTSSTDTDYYKIIKYNNIIIYILFLMLIELNPGQILGIKNDKRYNYFMYKKIDNNLLNDIFIRINKSEKINIKDIELLSYIIYVFSGSLINNHIWLWNSDTDNKVMTQINIHKSIINTMIDLINSISEANLEDNKVFLYQIISQRFYNKIHNLYNDKNLLIRIEQITNKFLNYDEDTKKIIIIKKDIPLVDIKEIKYNIEKILPKRCNNDVYIIDKKTSDDTDNNISILSNCANGSFHKWTYKNNDLICSLCNKSYNQLLKILNKDDNIEYLNKLKYINLKKLSKKYCITTFNKENKTNNIYHDINDKNICSFCKHNINEYEPTDKELDILNKMLEINNNDVSLSNINKLKQHIENEKKKNDETLIILNKLKNNYNKNLNHFIDEFIKLLSNKIGNKIKVFNNQLLYMNDGIYTIDHDYTGNSIKSPFTILESEKIILFEENHKMFNKDVLYYKDKSHHTYVYYDAITLNYLGYSEDNKKLITSKHNVILKYNLSLRDMFLLLGYENKYFNLLHIDKEFNDKHINNEMIDDIIRLRTNNLKHIIYRIQNIIYIIKNKGKVSIHNKDENFIINEFNNKFKNIITMKDDRKLFKHIDIILKNISINISHTKNNINVNNNYINIYNLNEYNNNDCLLIYYIIHNLTKLIEFNKDNNINELCNLIIHILYYTFNIYYRPYSNIDIRKFDFMLINEMPYIDETIQITNHYQELLKKEEIDDPQEKERKYDDDEAKTSLDIDDYEGEEDEDFDPTAEALDGYEN
jgi:hypothetical protein